MRSKFDEQLVQLNEEMIKMGTMVEENIQRAIDALVKSDLKTAKEIMENATFGSIEKEEYLLRMGEMPKYLYFI